MYLKLKSVLKSVRLVPKSVLLVPKSVRLVSGSAQASLIISKHLLSKWVTDKNNLVNSHFIKTQKAAHSTFGCTCKERTIECIGEILNGIWSDSKWDTSSEPMLEPKTEPKRERELEPSWEQYSASDSEPEWVPTMERGMVPMTEPEMDSMWVTARVRETAHWSVIGMVTRTVREMESTTGKQ